MRRRLLISLAVIAIAAAVPAGAHATPVAVLGHDGRVTHRDDRFLSPDALTPAPASAWPGVVGGNEGGRDAHAVRGGGNGGVRDAHGVRGSANVAGGGAGLGSSPTQATNPTKPKKKKKKKKKKKAVTVGSVLAGLARRHQITPAVQHQMLDAFDAALGAEKRLRGTRKSELAAVTETVHTMAAHRQLTPSRLPVLTATLEANRKWWTSGSLLSSGARVEFSGSQLVWQYYPGQGIQLQVLGTFGKVDGMYSAGPSQYPAMEQLLSEMIPLAVQRGGGLTWEYYFSFDGGSPPWTSAMSQATGLEALTRAYEASHNDYYLQVAGKAMGVFNHAPPQGVAVRTPRGVRFVQYTFAPKLSILNAFLQTLIGLNDYGQVSGDRNAQRLFARGNAEAEWEVPHFDTGAWSLYSTGDEDSLSYHQLVTGFLQQLCEQIDAPVYCNTAQRFTDDQKTPPALDDLTPHVKPHKPFALRFRLSKISHVGVVIARRSRTVFATSATFSHGVNHVSVGRLGAGNYDVTLAGTDLAGNFARATSTLKVAR